MEQDICSALKLLSWEIIFYGVALARQLTEVVFSCGVNPSFILNLYKGKGQALDHGNCRGLKPEDQVIELMEWVQNVDIHKLVKMQVRCSSDLCLAE